MSNAIKQAILESDKSLQLCRLAVKAPSSAILSDGPNATGSTRTDLSKAEEQLKHFTGWVYASVRPIAQKIAGQPIRVGVRKRPSKTKTSPSKTKTSMDDSPRPPRELNPRLPSTGSDGRPAGMMGSTYYSKGVEVEPLQSHELLDLLADPNDLQVAWSLIYVTVASLELTGRALWWLTEVDGKRSILPIPTSWIKSYQGSTSITGFIIKPKGTSKEYPIPADECCYFSYPDPADPKGAWSPLQAIASSVDSDEAIEASRITAFRQGIHNTHAIRIGKDADGFRPRLTSEQQRQLVAVVKRRYAGVNNREPLVLDSLIEDVFPLNRSNEEMDWLNSEKSTKSRIMQGFGTNPIIAGEIEGANRASSLSAEDHFVTYCINPKIELLSQTLTEWLGPMFGDIVVWIEPAVVHDTEMTLKWVELLTQQGAISNEELRSLSPMSLSGAASVGKRSPLLATVGGMQGSVAIMQAVGAGMMSTDTAAKLLALFFEIPLDEATNIVGKGSLKPAIDAGAVGVNELRSLAGLPPDTNRVGDLAGGRDAKLLGPLERGIRGLVDASMGDREADTILRQLEPTGNGRK